MVINDKQLNLLRLIWLEACVTPNLFFLTGDLVAVKILIGTNHILCGAIHLSMWALYGTINYMHIEQHYLFRHFSNNQ